jgi:hypothetical protein
VKELIDLQKALRVPKDQEGHNYNYRTLDGIQAAVKKEAPENVFVILTDEMVCVGDKNYMKATATIFNGKESLCASSLAREPDKLGSQSTPQISGSCSTYARKKALEGLLALDDGESDPDNPNIQIKEETSNKDERFSLEETANAAIENSKWPEAKKKALKLGIKKHSDDFLRNIINGKV